jgi:hypothetical protein
VLLNITRSGLCYIILHAEIEYKRNNDLFYSLNVYKKRQRLYLHVYVDVILFVMCKENHTICNVYINHTQPMFGSCFISCLLDGACLIYVSCVCVCVCVWYNNISFVNFQCVFV